ATVRREAARRFGGSIASWGASSGRVLRRARQQKKESPDGSSGALGGFSHGRGLAAEQVNRFLQDRVVVETQRERGRAGTRRFDPPALLKFPSFFWRGGHLQRRLGPRLVQGLS